MRGYYQTSQKWALEAIKNRRLKLSRLEEMNDPFELLGVSLKAKEDRLVFRQIKRDLHNEVGVLCFSNTWQNPVMWSHYGDKHYGLCLGFDLLDKFTYKVSYNQLRLKREADESFSLYRDKLRHTLLTTKYKHWEYEEEVRMIIQLEDAVCEGGLYFLPFCEVLQLQQVIIGTRSNKMPTYINRIISKEDSGVTITKSRMAFRSFRIVRNRAINAVVSGNS